MVSGSKSISLRPSYGYVKKGRFLLGFSVGFSVGSGPRKKWSKKWSKKGSKIVVFGENGVQKPPKMGFFGHFFHLFSPFFSSFFSCTFHTHFFGRFGVVFWTQNRSFLPSETSEPPPFSHFFGRPTLLSVSRCLLHSRQLVRCHARLGILWSTVKAITMEGGW